MLIRYLRTAGLIVASALSLGPSLAAQSPGRTSTGPTTRAWLGGAVGVTGTSAGAVLQWEGGIAYGLFAAGYQDSKSDDFSGGSRHEQVVFGGVQLPWRRLAVLLAGGAANAMKCSGAGDQSSYCTRSRDFHVPVIKLSAEAPVLPFVGLYLSTLQPIRRDATFPTYIIGLEIGKLR
jgi:hypothetical protein